MRTGRSTPMQRLRLAKNSSGRRDALSIFNLCDERKRHDHVWPMEIRKELSHLAMTQELRTRSQLVTRIHNRLLAEGQTVDAARLRAVFEEEVDRLAGRVKIPA